MRIGINTLFFIPGKVGGTEIFLRELVGGLEKIDKRNKYIIFTNNENYDVFNKLSGNFCVVRCPFDATNRILRILWEQIILPLQCIYFRLDLLHSPGYTAPIFTHCKKITTIFDLNYHYHPEDTGKLQNIIYKIIIPLVARTSDLLIVHSHNSKKEISKVLNINQKKIVVVYPGVSKYFTRIIPKNKIKNFFGLKKIATPFILSSAVSHPHKNLSSLLHAYMDLVTNKNIKQKLVLLGFPGRDQKALDDMITTNKVKEMVIFTGWINHEESAYFFQSADLFVFPSLYEGFGLPLIEAMASGVPLVASKYSCIPEVVSGGGLIVDTKDVGELSSAMYKVLNNQKLQKKLISKGRERAKYFIWESSIKQTLALYEKLVENHDE